MLTSEAARPAAPEPILAARGVSKRYRRLDGTYKQVLRDVDLELGDQEFVSILGPSGCGKTTFLRICANLIPASSGVIQFKGDVGTVPPRMMGYSFQQPALLAWRTVLSNILLPAHILKLDRKAATARARELLELVGLPGTEDLYPQQLSGGMQQRVAIARSLLHEPRVLFMDEPFGALDAMTREELNGRLQEVHSDQGVSIMFVTHSIQEAIFLSDRVIVLPGPMSDAAPREVRITLPRPRTEATLVSEEFRALEAELRAALDVAHGPVHTGADKEDTDV